MGVHDWLDNMLPPGVSESQNIYEVKFKSTRKAFYRNPKGLDVVIGDYVVVEADRGYDVGCVSMGGELARLRMRKKKVNASNLEGITALATEQDMEKLNELRDRELDTLRQARAIIGSEDLPMKLSDVEYQGDGSRVIFYFTAEKRIDFRALLKRFAHEFRARVELKQIGARQEAGRVGGVGSCGRELCCSSWLTDFKSVKTEAARYQNLSLNPTKITGMCGRLKCCLNYELETYLDALKDIPRVRSLKTEGGTAWHQKTDLFRRIMWFSYGDSNWIPLSIEQVNEFIDLNKKGKVPPPLVDLVNAPGSDADEREPDFVDVVGQSDLHLEQGKRKKKKKKSGGGGGRGGERENRGGGGGRSRGGKGGGRNSGRGGGGERGGN